MAKHTQPTKKYWFKRRLYGYGWVPVTWQGTVITVVPLLAIIGLTYLYLTDEGDPTPRGTFCYLATIVLLVGVLVGLSYLTGPKPKWRWGRKPTDNPGEDF